MNLDKASRLIDEYGLLLENKKHIVKPISSLPSSKEDIKEAIKTMILLLVVKEGRGFEGIEQIKVSYASLADFIDDKDAKVVHEFEDAIQSHDVNYIIASEKVEKALAITKKVNDDFAGLLHELDAWLKNRGRSDDT
jgi:hypothetical protein